ncbi:OLC1v1007007C1 [Oldenlandia corymbosa var. corymbosa]|uniref:OLC1v1007007C1 n=1 Tax=Oldenlandia corymbosa var. corymbosa TaxID=529605 RepID=A0AAV1DLD0_OLDCO|nr:OLC1v1007007C1 [Oldenlandia corymbosa var. corymbosa]
MEEYEEGGEGLLDDKDEQVEFGSVDQIDEVDDFHGISKTSEGTTILSFVTKQGIMVGADTQRSSHKTGESTGTKNKIYSLGNRILAVAAGCVDRSTRLLRRLQHEFEAAENGDKPMSFRDVYDWIKNEFSHGPLSASWYEKWKGRNVNILLVGWTLEPKTKRHKCNIVVMDDLGHSIRKNSICVGSGKSFAAPLLILDYEPNMEFEASEDLAKRCICLASLLDNKTGGDIHLGILQPDRWMEIPIHKSIDELLETEYPWMTRDYYDLVLERLKQKIASTSKKQETCRPPSPVHVCQLACAYASLILLDLGISITAEKIATLLKASNLAVPSYWPILFAELCEKKNVLDLILNVGGPVSPVAEENT